MNSNLKINIGVQNDIVIMRLTGNLVASTTDNFKTEVTKLIEKNFIHILVDMSKVNFMDSSGLGACMASHKTVSEKKGVIVFVKLNETVQKVFHITRADQRLAVCKEESEGLTLFRKK